MVEHRLLHSFPAEDNKGLLTYGGSQLLSDSAVIRKCGCGVVAAADLLLYLHRHRRGCTAELFNRYSAERSVDVEDYNQILKTLCRRYFPLTPPVGINGLGLCYGLNRFFRQNAINLNARWGVSYHRLWSSIEYMIDSDIPVIFAVGPNFPQVWQNDTIGLYTRLPNGSYKKIGTVKAHFMSVTAISDMWLTMSSWGHKYFINRPEYENYVKTNSSKLVCNIVYIEPR